MSDKPVNQDNPTLGQTKDTYDDTAVFLSGKLRDEAREAIYKDLMSIVGDEQKELGEYGVALRKAIKDYLINT